MPGLETLALIISSVATTTIGANALFLGTYALAYAGLAVGSQLLQSLFVQKPSVPRPEDGSFNLKQAVPSLPIVMGRVKKAGDYLFLEERDGVAYHIICHAGHRCEGYVSHYLHDDVVTSDVDGWVTSPPNFAFNGYQLVNIETRLGLDTSEAYADVVLKFPEIWTDAHRGDGLTTIRMSAATVSTGNYLSAYPNQMPQHSAVIDGALLFDPRNEEHDPDDRNTWEFAQNIALMRLHQLTNPWGGKLQISDLYLPEWEHAADVCDQTVLNRDGDPEPRYHGAIWFRANSDQIQVGRLLDQAADMVVYERPDGLIGVHSGEFVAPTLRLTADDIFSLNFKANRSKSSTVLAVRGRYTAPDQSYNTVDAAIVGDPYIGEATERTKTFDNQIVQRHNHCQRGQTLMMKRANAPRVAILATYEAASDIIKHRFITVHYPPKMEEAIVEITSTPKLSFGSLTVEFSGIIVSEALYDFVASTDEGEPPAVPVKLDTAGVPDPVNFDVVLRTETLAGGQVAAYAYATWDLVSEALTYEFEWQPTEGPSQVANSVMSRIGDLDARSSYLADGYQHRFRLRAWSNGSPSAWTSYVTLSVVADPVAPAALTSFTLTSSAPHLGNAVFSIVTPNDSHLKTVKLYRKATGVALNVAVDTPFAIQPVASSLSATYSGIFDGDISRTNLVSNGSFLTDLSSWAAGSGFAWSAGKASKTAGVSSSLDQVISLTAGSVYRTSYAVVFTAGTSFRIRLLNGAVNQNGTLRTASGTYRESLTALAGNTAVSMFTSSSFAGTVDDVVVYLETPSCAPSGVWDYYAVPFNGSNIDGPPSGPVTVTIV